MPALIAPPLSNSKIQAPLKNKNIPKQNSTWNKRQVSLVEYIVKKNNNSTKLDDSVAKNTANKKKE